jgi:hypothetical protein
MAFAGTVAGSHSNEKAGVSNNDDIAPDADRAARTDGAKVSAGAWSPPPRAMAERRALPERPRGTALRVLSIADRQLTVYLQRS